jgi:hypothetical protein
LPPALLLVLHFPQRVAVLLFPIRFGHEVVVLPYGFYGEESA